jgi:hypothetical protein
MASMCRTQSALVAEPDSCPTTKMDISIPGAKKKKTLYMQELDHQSLFMLFVEEVLPFKEWWK